MGAHPIVSFVLFSLIVQQRHTGYPAPGYPGQPGYPSHAGGGGGGLLGGLGTAMGAAALGTALLNPVSVKTTSSELCGVTT